MLSSLVSEWTFDNPAKIGEDTWGSNHGTVHGSPQIKDGDECVFGACASFDGVNDYISVPSSSDVTGMTEFTYSFWVKVLKRRAHAGAISKWTWHSVQDYIINFDSDGKKIGFGVAYDNWDDKTSIDRDQTPDLEIGKWYYVVDSFKGEDFIRMYLDGKIVGNVSNITGKKVTGNSNALLFGKYGSYFFQGLLDDVRLYHKTLSSAEIKQNYIAGLDSMLSKGTLSKDEYNERIQALAEN